MRIEGSEFGKITIDGRTYDHCAYRFEKGYLLRDRLCFISAGYKEKVAQVAKSLCALAV